MTSSTSLPFIKSSILLFSAASFSAIFVGENVAAHSCDFPFSIGMTCPFLNRPEELQQLVFLFSMSYHNLTRWGAAVLGHSTRWPGAWRDQGMWVHLGEGCAHPLWICVGEGSPGSGKEIRAAQEDGVWGGSPEGSFSTVIEPGQVSGPSPVLEGETEGRVILALYNGIKLVLIWIWKNPCYDPWNTSHLQKYASQMHLKPRQRTVSSVTKRNCKMIFPKHYFCASVCIPDRQTSPEAFGRKQGLQAHRWRQPALVSTSWVNVGATGPSGSWVMLCFGPCQAGVAGDPRRWAHWVSVATRRLDVSLSASLADC